MKQKMMAAFLAMAMILGLLTGCGSADVKESAVTSDEADTSSIASVTSEVSASSETAAEEEYVVSYPYETDVKLKIYIGGGLPLSSTYTDYNDVPFFQGLVENIGIDVEWMYPVTGSDATAAYNLMLLEEELPHIVIGNYCSAAQMSVLLEDCVALNIDPYIAEYAPAYNEVFILPEDEDSVKNRKLVSVDGEIPSFNAVRESAMTLTYLGPLVRQDWLDNLGLEVPETIQDVEDVLVAFKEEYGAMFTTDLDHFFVGALGAYAGLNTDYYLDDNDTVQYANVQPEWKDWLMLMNKWVEMGILDPNIATADTAYVAQMALEEKMGMSYNAMSQHTKWRQEAEAAGLEADWIGFANPTNEAGDPNKWIQTSYATVHIQKGAYITNACDTEEELKAAMAWCNWAYTEEGQMYWNYGTEGVSYEMVNGEPQFTDKLWNDERGLAQALRDYSGASVMPLGVQLDGFSKAKNDPLCFDALELWTSNQTASVHKVPDLPQTSDEQKVIADLAAAFNTYSEEMALKFVLGEESFDNWDEYVETVESMGLQQVLDVKNAAYARYKMK